MGGGSDYLWFLNYGIPAGGLATGAGSIKSYEERDLFGGVALAPYDLCYHQSCDTVRNIDTFALGVNLHAAASVVEKFAMELPFQIQEAHTVPKYGDLSSSESADAKIKMDKFLIQ